PHQLTKVAELGKKYGSGTVHVTTRQDIQIHEVDIEHTPDVLEGLLEVGLAARGGGGNTVRNVTACPRAGVCPREQSDVAPYAIAVAEYLLQFKSSYNLPRKYKIVFSGCSNDCAFASVADLGFFAHVKDGQKGFAVYAGGGLGANPAVAVKIEDFVAEGEILEVAEAVRRVFDKNGDRSNKHKARLRYVLGRVGEDEFRKLYKAEREQLAEQGLEGDIPTVRPLEGRFEVGEACAGSDSTVQEGPNIEAEKAAGLYSLTLRLHLGDISAEDLTEVGRIADELGAGVVRTTQLQNLLITSVKAEKVDEAVSRLRAIGIEVVGDTAPQVVACTGAATCKLGLCLSRGLGEAIEEELAKVGRAAESSEIAMRISGCPNSCGHHYIAPIGFQGRAKRIQGKLMPFYDVLVGAKTVEGQAELGRTIATVPARSIPQLVADAFSAGAVEGDAFTELAQKYEHEAGAEYAEEYFYDYGSSEPFSLAGRGPGECGAGVMDVMKVDIDEAKTAIKAAATEQGGEKDGYLYKAAVAAARTLLVIFGIEPTRDREIFGAFKEHLIDPGWVAPEAQEILDRSIDWRLGDRDSIGDSDSEIAGLVDRVEQLFLSLDAALKFQIEPVANAKEKQESSGEVRSVDLRGVACPLNFVKAKLELEKIAVGDVLEVLLDAGEPVRNVPESFLQQGQNVLEVKETGDHFTVKVRREK
ncbi:MAG: sulfurtransferase TusA family protein, partial [Planctomycetota bacterium]